jgi:uncharacterized membrane protein
MSDRNLAFHADIPERSNAMIAGAHEMSKCRTDFPVDSSRQRIQKLQSETFIGSLGQPLSAAGLLLGNLFILGSLTPSLLPRSDIVQGALSGASMSLGYSVGSAFSRTWALLMLPTPPQHILRMGRLIATMIALAASALGLNEWGDDQNSAREIMSLSPVETLDPVIVAVVGCAVFASLLAIGRLFLSAVAVVARPFRRVSSERAAFLLGLVAVSLLTALIFKNVLLSGALRAADASFSAVDQMMPASLAAPTDPLRTGSTASLVPWDRIGLRGREFLAATPSGADLAELSGAVSQSPIRVYVGLGTAPSIEERAAVAVRELQRTGGFDRAVLVVATPTGTGWMDPASSLPLEVLHRGDVATVAVQYSYLTSWLSLLVEPDYATRTARALFDAIYAEWTTLPRDQRPRLYLHGLSLGSLGSEASSDILTMFEDPIQGALWVGPPFASRGWRTIVDGRTHDSTVWLPRYRDSRIVRFANQDGLDPKGVPWGPLRIVYLQYASDPVTFFTTDAAFREPTWLKGPRGPDVSSDLIWRPIVTFLQLAFDIANATSTPIGFGHVYAPEHYLNGWYAVTQPEGWTEASLSQLRARLAKRLRN